MPLFNIKNNNALLCDLYLVAASTRLELYTYRARCQMRLVDERIERTSVGENLRTAFKIYRTGTNTDGRMDRYTMTYRYEPHPHNNNNNNQARTVFTFIHHIFIHIHNIYHATQEESGGQKRERCRRYTGTDCHCECRSMSTQKVSSGM